MKRISVYLDIFCESLCMFFCSTRHRFLNFNSLSTIMHGSSVSKMLDKYADIFSIKNNLRNYCRFFITANKNQKYCIQHCKRSPIFTLRTERVLVYFSYTISINNRWHLTDSKSRISRRKLQYFQIMQNTLYIDLSGHTVTQSVVVYDLQKQIFQNIFENIRTERCYSTYIYSII